MDRGVMSESIIKVVLEELRKNIDAVKIVVLYHGGEPLLNSRFYQIVAGVKSINPALYVKTVTNGMALNQRNSIKLIESGIDAIEISLDGLSAIESQHIRKHSDTGRIITNVKKLLSLRADWYPKTPTVSLATTQFVRTTQQVFPLPPAAPPDWLKIEFGDAVDYKATYAVRWPHMMVGDYDQLHSPAGHDKSDCDHVVNTITIRSDGDVVPCCYDLTSKLVMGNITTQSLRSIWEGTKYRQLRDTIASRNFYSICRTCAVVTPPIYLVPKEKIRIPLTPIGTQ
jgi:radical SAM protein with 4Fe4S-binding SPASM domain